MEEFFKYAAITISFVLCGVGFPVQIIKNWQRKSTEGLSLFLTFLWFLNGFIWLSYGISKSPKDWVLITANIPSNIFVLILLAQFYFYRKIS